MTQSTFDTMSTVFGTMIFCRPVELMLIFISDSYDTMIPENLGRKMHVHNSQRSVDDCA